MEKIKEIPVTNKNEMDPRQKDTQGLDYWAGALLKNNIISQGEYDDFISKNNSKEKIMEDMKLPQLAHYGYFDSVEEIREALRDKKDTKFIIRCSSKETGDVKRLLDANLDEVCEYAQKLPGGMDKWGVEVKEFVKTIAAGTIVVSPSGRTDIEMWHGAHYLNTTNCPKYHGSFDPEKFDMHFDWKAPDGSNDIGEMQNYALKALRYHFQHLKPKENEPIYIEYGIKEGGEVYFIEANDSVLLTGK